jgi:hypothetical protein
VLVVLAVATIVEFVIAAAVSFAVPVWLLIIALGKAWLIVVYFMHVAQVRQRGAEHD